MRLIPRIFAHPDWALDVEHIEKPRRPFAAEDSLAIGHLVLQSELPGPAPAVRGQHSAVDEHIKVSHALA